MVANDGWVREQTESYRLAELGAEQKEWCGDNSSLS